MNRQYIVKQLSVYGDAHRPQASREDALWRIASHCNLTKHPSTLTPTDRSKTLNWLQQNGYSV